jgi:hypothetical protein
MLINNSLVSATFKDVSITTPVKSTLDTVDNTIKLECDVSNDLEIGLDGHLVATGTDTSLEADCVINELYTQPVSGGGNLVITFKVFDQNRIW